jgi:hypothetical protein
MKILLHILFYLLFLPGIIKGQDQDIKAYLDAYIGENAKPYLQPLADLFASNINTGIWEWSKDDSTFYFRLKAQAIASFPSTSMRTFTGKTTGDFKPEQTAIVPTIIGDRDAVLLQGSDTTFYIFPGGYDLKRLTLGTPQLTIGGFLHSEISGRFLSFTLGKDIGKVNFIGIGVRHFISDYFKTLPFDFSVGYFYHRLQTGTYLDSDQQLISVHLGKSGKFFSGQIMAGYQTSDSALHYTYDNDGDPINVDLSIQNKNNLIFEASAGLRLGLIYLCGAISYAQHPSISAGFAIGF